MSSVATALRRIDRDLETIALTDTSWRVCDASLPDDDGTRLLAYVETVEGDDPVDGRVETLWMWPHAGDCTTFDSLDAALEAVLRRLDARRPLTPLLEAS